MSSALPAQFTCSVAVATGPGNLDFLLWLQLVGFAGLAVLFDSPVSVLQKASLSHCCQLSQFHTNRRACTRGVRRHV